VAVVKANLLDENEQLVDTVTVDSDESYAQNGYFQTPDGGLYLIAEVKEAERPVDIELSVVWVDGPHPTSRLK
jgi:hypothetical protein